MLLGCNSFSIRVVLFVLFTFDENCRAGVHENKIVSLLVGSGNKISKTFALFRGRKDFNTWFATRKWKLKEVAGTLTKIDLEKYKLYKKRSNIHIASIH